jgi:hypothetical protein
LVDRVFAGPEGFPVVDIMVCSRCDGRTKDIDLMAQHAVGAASLTFACSFDSHQRLLTGIRDLQRQLAALEVIDAVMLADDAYVGCPSRSSRRGTSAEASSSGATWSPPRGTGSSKSRAKQLPRATDVFLTGLRASTTAGASVLRWRPGLNKNEGRRRQRQRGQSDHHESRGRDGVAVDRNRSSSSTAAARITVSDGMMNIG